MHAEYKSRVDSFLQSRRIAVLGYSSNPKGGIGNAIYDRLQKSDYEMIAVNPKAEQITAVKCYRDLSQAPRPIDAAILVTPPAATMAALRDCVAAGIKKIWIHRSVDGGSYVPEADQFALENGLELISFGCPLMFVRPDIFHRCLRWIYDKRGKLSLPLSARDEPVQVG